ncbi:endolytic transglycosylase MltG [bacterium]|nr:endolytic transglycosylase MltG [bacterium]
MPPKKEKYIHFAESLSVFLKNTDANVQKILLDRIFQKRATMAFGIFALAAGLFYIAFSPPRDFPSGTIVRIPEGATLVDAADILAEEGIIRSPFALRFLVMSLRGEASVFATDYFFGTPTWLFSVSDRILSGESGIPAIRVTVPEGATKWDIADILSRKLPSFNRNEFFALAHDKEGYLFPDTYFFLPTASVYDIISRMNRNFYDRIDPLKKTIEASGKNLSDIIILASILEKEARTFESKRVIAGILWHRLELGMPLQVDAVFLYINGKSTFDLTYDDLAVANPYNTYKYKGLPVGPIANPGLDSILAAFDPEPSEYLFYLSDMEGNMHYAVNFEEHKENKRKYLR